MKNKYLKFLITVSVVVCVLFSSTVMCFAVPEKPETTKTTVAETEPPVEPEETEAPETERPDVEVVPVEPSTKAPITVVPPTSQVVTQPTTQKRPAPVGTTRRPSNQSANNNNNDNNNDNDNDDDNARNSTTTTKPVTTLPELPEGSFYVFLELNNGQPRLKRVMEKEGRVPPPNMPVREGYAFDGWYLDAKFTKPWDFDTSVAKDTVVIYAKWVADGSTVSYKITVPQVAGGSIEVNPAAASKGEPVTITVKPDKGMRLVSGSLTINGKKSDVLSFIMPASDVVIGAKFEKIPADEIVEEESVSIVPFIIGAVVVVLAVAGIAIAVAKRKADYQVPEFDESGALIIDDDDDDGWIDESIVIEDGFENGKIVKENVEPDYGAPDAEDEDY